MDRFEANKIMKKSKLVYSIQYDYLDIFIYDSPMTIDLKTIDEFNLQSVVEALEKIMLIKGEI